MLKHRLKLTRFAEEFAGARIWSGCPYRPASN